MKQFGRDLALVLLALAVFNVIKNISTVITYTRNLPSTIRTVVRLKKENPNMPWF